MSTQARQLFAPGKTTWIKSIQSGFTYPGGANAKRCFSKGIDIWIFLPKFKSVGRFLFRIPQIESFPSENPIFELHCWFWIESCIFEEKWGIGRKRLPPSPCLLPFWSFFNEKNTFWNFFDTFCQFFGRMKLFLPKPTTLSSFSKNFPLNYSSFATFPYFLGLDPGQFWPKNDPKNDLKIIRLFWPKRWLKNISHRTLAS